VTAAKTGNRIAADAELADLPSYTFAGIYSPWLYATGSTSSPSGHPCVYGLTRLRLVPASGKRFLHFWAYLSLACLCLKPGVDCRRPQNQVEDCPAVPLPPAMRSNVNGVFALSC
jgi:hypothetical protein